MRCFCGGDHEPIAFLKRALARFARHDVTVERIMTDNGKVERFRQTVLREGIYARAVRSSPERAVARCPRWLHIHNMHRPHTVLAGQPPISRIAINTSLLTTATQTVPAREWLA